MNETESIEWKKQRLEDSIKACIIGSTVDIVRNWGDADSGKIQRTIDALAKQIMEEIDNE